MYHVVMGIKPEHFQLVSRVRRLARAPVITLVIPFLIITSFVIILQASGYLPNFYWLIMLFQTLGMILAYLVVSYGARWFLRWQSQIPEFIDADARDEFQGWLEDRNSIFVRSPYATATGGFVATLAALIYIYIWQDQTQEHPITPVLTLIIMLPTGYVAGECIAVLWHFSRFVAALGDFPIINEDYITGVRSTGRVLVMIYLAATLPWLCYTASSVPLPSAQIALNFLALPAVVFYLVSFTTCQIPLHKRMVDYKRDMVIKWSSQLRAIEPDSPDDLTEDRLRKIDYYQSKLRQACDLPEWPFNYKQTTTIVFSALAAVGLPQLLGSLNLIQM
tara:strand:+ start:2693 stop:3694 length:1002 start_codon:yes stop_codon:yes gene_type:complete